MRYATVADMQAYLDQLKDKNDAGTVALLNSCLERASSIVDGALGFAFEQSYAAPGVRSVVSYGGEWLELPTHQAGSVTQVAWGGLALTAGMWTEEGGMLRVVQPLGLITWGLSYPSVPAYQWAQGRYDVTATWGYGPPPASIIELTLELAVNIWRSKDKGLFTEVIGAEGGGSVRYVGGLNKLQQQIIDNVRRAYVPPSVTI